MPRKKPGKAPAADKLFLYCELRRQGDGSARPRFKPGPRERALGFVPQDLKHADGSWFSLDEVVAFSAAKRAEIAEARTVGHRVERVAPNGKTATVADLMKAYLTSPTFRDKPASTRRMYDSAGNAILYKPRLSKKLKHDRPPRVSEPFAATPAILVRKANVKAFYDHLVKIRGRTTARGAIMVLSAAYNWCALQPGWEITPNPCHDLGLPSPAARLVTWELAEAAAMVAAAADLGLNSIGDAIIIGLYSGQRENDILALCDAPGANRSLAERVRVGEPIRLIQSKTGARVSIFPAPDLIRRLLEAEKRRRVQPLRNDVAVPIVLCEASGEEWNASTFQHEFAKVRALAGTRLPSLLAKCDAATGKPVGPIHFQDLRDTAVTWLATAGCTLPEICSITGHSLAAATQIMRHYLDLNEAIAHGASKKLSAWLLENKMAVGGVGG